MRIKKLFSTPLKATLSIVSLIAIIAILSTGTVYAASTIAQNSSIGAENAKNFSFADAGIDPTTAKAVQIEFEYEQGQFVYEVEFIADGTEYEYWINASDGTVVKKNIEIMALEDANTVASTQNANTGAIDSKSKEVQKEQKPEASTAQQPTESTNKDNAAEAKQNKANSKDNADKPATNKPQAAAEQITLDAAKAKALADAGVTSSSVTYTQAELDYEDGIAVYDIEFYTSTHEYEYEINAVSGTVLDKSVESLPKNTGSKQNKTDGAESKGNSGTYIGIDKAKTIVTNHAGLSLSEVTFSKAKLDTDDKNTIYELEFYEDGIEYEYEVDAASGEILEYEAEQAD